MLKKAMKSEGMIVVGRADLQDKFPVGFSYKIEEVIYTVKKVLSKDTNTSMRRVITSSGEVEDLEVSSIMKDLKEPGCQILCQGEEIKIADVKEEETKKVESKKEELEKNEEKES